MFFDILIGVVFAALVAWGFLFVFGKIRWPFKK